jgi:sugar phosphate isomerase/epimerase
MRLSFYTYSYTDRLKMSVADCHERIAKTGYQGIDVSGTNGNSEDPKSFDAERRKLTRQTAENLKVRVEAVITHAGLTDSLMGGKHKPLDLNGTIDLAVEVGADVVTFHMGGYHDGISREAEWKRTVGVLKAAADYGAARHVRLAVDGIWLTWIVNSPDELARLFDDVGSPTFGVNLDPSYLTLMGIDPVTFTKRFPNRIFHAHLKDFKREGRQEIAGVKNYPKWTELIPGTGEMDYSRVFKALGEIKFNGAAAVECFTNMKFEEACDQGYANMVAAAKKGGVKFERT